MEYKDFETLYWSNPVAFHLGMELFLENGRDRIESNTDQELRKAVACKLSGFVAGEKLQEAVSAAKDFAALESVVLLSYAGRCGIRLEDEPVDEPGVCPLCGGVLEYALPFRSGDTIRDWHCPDCGTRGKEAYQKVFDSHYNVMDCGCHMVDHRNQKKQRRTL